MLEDRRTTWVAERPASRDRLGDSGTATAEFLEERAALGSRARCVDSTELTRRHPRAARGSAARERAWDRRGMVVGHVQSGKTARLHRSDLQGGRCRVPADRRARRGAQQPAEPDAAPPRRGIPGITTPQQPTSSRKRQKDRCRARSTGSRVCPVHR